MRLYTRAQRAFGVLLVASLAGGLVAAGCSGDDDAAATEPSGAASTVAPTTIREIVVDGGELAPATTVPDVDPVDTVTTAAVTNPTTTPPTTEPVVLPPAGTLRYAEGGGTVSFNPAAVNSAQTSVLFPVYDTLTRQTADLVVVPGLATSWTRPDPVTWEFTVRDDVVFHDGTPFDAQAAVDNIGYHANFEGNPQSSTWVNLVEARVIDATTFHVEFSQPAPQFPLQMSTAPGMMINPNYLDGADLTRNPQGSGPWIWSAEQSQAGVREVYELNPNYWNPADQGVERIVFTSYPDNIARLNALLTGEADVSAFTQDAQVQTGLDAGMQLVAVPNFFPFLLIADREGGMFPELADQRVRQAIGYAIDRDAYNDIVHAGRGNTSGAIFPANFSQFYVPELEDLYTYDPERARELLAEAGYPNGFTLQMPVMPVIQPVVELVAQMLGAVGVTVELTPLNNGELGGRLAAGEVGITWLRQLQLHPGTDLMHFIEGIDNPFGLDDLDDAAAAIAEAIVEDDPEAARELYGEAMRILLETGAILPLGHSAINAMYSPSTTGVVMGLGMQGPLPYGVRVGP
ncbi:MAG TPA: ABC transporter substrate-binding protein [Ilumatobacter sp.]|nr:ABC transporter substrate-binding protein [Ilumatobacter sp.]